MALKEELEAFQAKISSAIPQESEAKNSKSSIFILKDLYFPFFY